MPTSALNGETPYYHWKKKKPDISYFRVFGCLAYVLIREEKRKALQPHSKKCIFVGYPDGIKAWRFWDPVDRRIIISSHAVFDERCFPGNSTVAINLVTPLSDPFAPSQVVLHQGGDDEIEDDEAPEAPVLAADNPAPVVQETRPDAPAHIPHAVPLPTPPIRRQNPPRASRHQGSFNEKALQQQVPTPTVPVPTPPTPPPCLPAVSTPDPFEMRSTTPPMSPVTDSSSDDELLLKDNHDSDLEYADAFETGFHFLPHGQESAYLTLDQAAEYAFDTAEHAFKTAAHNNEPNTFHEAMKCPKQERDHWYKAALDEIQSLIENGTFELVELPPGQKAIGSRWVFRVKRNVDGSIKHHKARLVAKGFAQHPGFDYTETFAPTPKWAALRAILALAALEDLHLESVDISSAFLNGTLTEEVYMQQPEGFVEKGITGSGIY